MVKIVGFQANNSLTIFVRCVCVQEFLSFAKNINTNKMRKVVIAMFGNIDDMLRLNDICRESVSTERKRMTEELINRRKFSSDEIMGIIELSIDDIKELARKKTN